jgi:DNA-binding LacI/PurR family transcriptional regulator
MKIITDKLTIHDLAKALDLSSGTISKILNGKGNIPHATRQRVIDYVKNTGYVASHSARILKASHSWTIGIVFSDIALFGLEHPFFGSIIQAFKNYIEEKGYEIVFIPKKLGVQEQSYLQWARNKQVDGILLLTGDKNRKDIIELVNSEVPCVSTDMEMNHLTTVISDDEEGITLVYNHFLAQGFKHIYAYSGSTLSRAYQQRTEAYQQLLKKHHKNIDELNYFVTEAYGYHAAYQNALKWMDSWKVVPDAIIAFSDDIAMGLIRALQFKGYKVPEDISVSGYDDIQFAPLFAPALTTVKQQKKDIAQTAADALLSLIHDPESPRKSYKVPVQLIIRNSTK